MVLVALLENIQSEHFYKGRGISGLSGLVYVDLRKLYRLMIHNKRTDKLLEDALAMNCWADRPPEGRLRSPFNPQGLASKDKTYNVLELAREDYRRLTIINCLNDEDELWSTYGTVANFFAYKLSSETKLTYPASYLEKVCTEIREFPGVFFQRSRFINYEEDLQAGDKLFIKFLDKKGISRCSLVLSAFSSFSFSIVNNAHLNGHFPYRRSAVGSHLGLVRTVLKYSCLVHIISAKKVLKEVRSGCLPCRKQTEDTLPKIPGKVHKDRVMARKQGSGSIQLDLIPSIKLKAYPGARKTRSNTSSFIVHIVVACDIFSKFVHSV